jgi:hypothetical protein
MTRTPAPFSRLAALQADAHARLNPPGARPAPAAPRGRKREGIPGWFTWGVAAPLALLCPPVFVWLLLACLHNPRT